MNKHQDMIFPIKLTCPNCEKEFEHPEVKSKYIVIERQDRDFCSYFAGINPLFYDIMVCKYCGFAFTRETNIPLSEPEKAIIKTILANWHTDGYQYGGVRTLDMAIKAIIWLLFVRSLEMQRTQSKAPFTFDWAGCIAIKEIRSVRKNLYRGPWSL
ncbi:hypothetical protein N752_27500 [Desulforamulus aquiferis]|nr:hypothetical protein N752_27500 [Desulforamulus aquiferis]